MDKLVTLCLGLLGFYVPFLVKYIEDLILILPSDKQGELLNTFNSYNDLRETNKQWRSSPGHISY